MGLCSRQATNGGQGREARGVTEDDLLSKLVYHGHSASDVVDGYSYSRVYVQYYLCAIRDLEGSIQSMISLQLDTEGCRKRENEIRKIRGQISDCQDEIQRILDPKNPNISKRESATDKMRKSLGRLASFVGSKNDEVAESRSKKNERAVSRPAKNKPVGPKTRAKKINRINKQDG